jgi:hypothetical protein
MGRRNISGKKNSISPYLFKRLDVAHSFSLKTRAYGTTSDSGLPAGSGKSLFHRSVPWRFPKERIPGLEQGMAVFQDKDSEITPHIESQRGSK